MTVDSDFRRLAARGRFEILPWFRNVKTGVQYDGSGRPWEISETQLVVGLVWAPNGQWGNGWASKSVETTTIAEALTLMLEKSRPTERRIEDLVEWKMTRLWLLFHFMAGTPPHWMDNAA